MAGRWLRILRSGIMKANRNIIEDKGIESTDREGEKQYVRANMVNYHRNRYL